MNSNDTKKHIEKLSNQLLFIDYERIIEEKENEIIIIKKITMAQELDIRFQ